MSEQTKRVDAVFEGGGVKGIGLVGALSVVEAAGYQFASVAGTSAGAIIATLVAAGYRAAEIKGILTDLDFVTLMDAPPLGHIPLLGAAVDELTQLGLYQGDVFQKLMRDLLAKKGIHTFRDFIAEDSAEDERFRYRVRVVASDITRGTMLVLPQDISGYGLKPDDLDVALAVRMSMSIPLFFRPVQLKNPGGETSVVVDGGLLSNFPVELFDSPGIPEWPTFGFRLVQTGPPRVVRHHVGGPISELLALFQTAVEAHDARYIETHNFVRTIPIGTLGIAATEFNLTSDQKEALFQSGVAAAGDFLAHWDFEQYKELYRSGRPQLTRREQALP